LRQPQTGHENGIGWLAEDMILMQSELPENQPATLAAFVKRYHLREFDGRSDACLQPTMTSPANPCACPLVLPTVSVQAEARQRR